MNTIEQPLTTPRVGTAGSGSAAHFSARRHAFRTLHEAGCFMIPNPWDIGSARYLQHLGFSALATTSAGYGRAPQDVADNVTRCIATGVAGLSIEDATGDPSSPLYDLPLAVERVRAARQAIDQSRADVLLTARAECYLVGHPDPLRESVRRLQAYAEAGADVLFAPGGHDPGETMVSTSCASPRRG